MDSRSELRKVQRDKIAEPKERVKEAKEATLRQATGPAVGRPERWQAVS